MSVLPEPPAVPDWADEAEGRKARYQALLDEWKARQRDVAAREDKALAVGIARQDATVAAEVASRQSMQQAYVEVAKASLDRAISRASFMTGLIAAISGTYTTLLGLVYGIAETAEPLPGRAMIPVLFLGAALVLASFYVAFLRRSVKPRNLLPSGLGGDMADQRLKTFLDWVFSGVLDRAWALRTSIVAFGLGVAMLPLPFADVNAEDTRAIAISGAVVLVIWVGGELAYWRQTRSQPYVPDQPVPDPEVQVPPAIYY